MLEYWTCNIIDNISIQVCVPSKRKDVNVKTFNIITRIKEVKALLKHVSCDYKCKCDGTRCNSNQK